MKIPTAAAALFVAAVPAALAFPTGAGSCAAGPDKFIKNSQHEGKGGGSLADGGLAVWFGNINLDTDVGAEVPPGGQGYTPVGLCTGALNFNSGFNLCERCQGELGGTFSTLWPLNAAFIWPNTRELARTRLILFEQCLKNILIWISSMAAGSNSIWLCA
jgi:hypothetical protein